MRDDFCMLILSHDRAGDIPTLDTLERVGYTGDWYIVIDHEDEREEYEEEYGEDKVVFFDKEETIEDIDRGDNLDRRDANIYARNKSFDLAEELGYTYFMVVDDDYTGFSWRFNNRYKYEYNPLRDLDSFLEKSITFLEESGIETLCLAQGGDFIGGSEGSMAQQPMTKRKAMNTFLCKTDRPIDFVGRMNEDVNTYVRKQQLGDIMFTTNIASINQEGTQQHEGGLTDIYLEYGTYTKSFYTILYSPSCVSLSKMGNKDMRIHHKINWRNAVPKIVPEEVKK